MSKYWTTIYDRQQVLASFLEGFVAYSNLFARPKQIEDCTKNCLSPFGIDQLNLRNDLVKSSRTVLAENRFGKGKSTHGGNREANVA